MERRSFEYIVIGCGGIGSAALYWLSKRVGAGVLGIEQFEIGHSNGGSQDHSRIIRTAYHDEMYTKIVADTYTAFEEAEKESGLKLVHKCGGLLIAKKGETDDVATKYANAMASQDLPFEWLPGNKLKDKFPQFEHTENHVAVYEKDGGLVDAAMANAVHIQLAKANGAAVIEHCPVNRLTKHTNGQTTVHTTKGNFTCKKVIVTAGAWLNQVLGSIGVHIPVYVTQEQVTYLGTPHMKDFVKEKFPIFIYHSKDHDMYALPLHGNTGFKIGIDAGGPVVTAGTRNFMPDPVREKKCLDFIQEILPKAMGPILYTKTCLYTMTPDRNFVIDTCHRQGHENVIICNGAGHAFKWSALLGKILSEMAIDGRTQYDIAAFTMDRDAISNPNYKTTIFEGGSLSGGKDHANETKSKL